MKTYSVVLPCEQHGEVEVAQRFHVDDILEVRSGFEDFVVDDQVKIREVTHDRDLFVIKLNQVGALPAGTQRWIVKGQFGRVVKASQVAASADANDCPDVSASNASLKAERRRAKRAAQRAAKS